MGSNRDRAFCFGLSTDSEGGAPCGMLPVLISASMGHRHTFPCGVETLHGMKMALREEADEIVPRSESIFNRRNGFITEFERKVLTKAGNKNVLRTELD